MANQQSMFQFYFPRRKNAIAESSDDEDENWRKNINVGDVLLLQDARNLWWEVKVLDTKKATKSKPARVFIQYIIRQELPNPNQGEWCDVNDEVLDQKESQDVKPAYAVCCECYMCGQRDDMVSCGEQNCNVAVHNACVDAGRKWLCADHAT